MIPKVGRRAVLAIPVLAALVKARGQSPNNVLDLLPPGADARLPYGAAPLQFGDLRLPRNGSRHPALIVIHGGFWKSAYNLEHTGHLCAALATERIATWSLEYRRVGNPGGGWPGTAQDILRGAAHFWTIGNQYGIDLERVAVLGHSAGGQLALYLAAERKVRLRGVAVLAGVSDLRRAWELGLGGGAVDRFLGGSPQQIPAVYKQASPIERVPLQVPQCLIHGMEDDTVPVEISDRYIGAARRAGDRANLQLVSGTGHFELIDPRSRQWPSVVEAVKGLLG